MAVVLLALLPLHTWLHRQMAEGGVEKRTLPEYTAIWGSVAVGGLGLMTNGEIKFVDSAVILQAGFLLNALAPEAPAVAAGLPLEASARVLRGTRWTLAAVACVLARAGYKARRLEARVPPCPTDSRPVAAPRAIATLLRLLSDPDAGLIEEWAGLAHARGQRVADHVVPVRHHRQVATRPAAQFANPQSPVRWSANVAPH